MKKPGKTAIAILALVVVGAVAVTGATALGSGKSSRAVVKTGHALGKKVLVTRNGMTLYSLSAESKGRFICTTKACLSLWKPLVVAKGTKPTGESHLRTIRRPDGRTQVTYRQRPLYTFTQDMKPGQAKGEGFKDVGTWHVVTIGHSTAQSPSGTTTSPGYTY